MMKLLNGSFRPFLEEALLQRITRDRKNPLEPVAVVAPSAPMRERIEREVARSGRAVMNVHFHTLSSFVTSLTDAESEEGAVCSDPLLFDTLIRFLVKERKPFVDLEDLAVPQGFPPAVRSTLRDLTDAAVPFGADNPLNELVRERWVSREADIGPVLELLDLYRAFHTEVSRLKLRPRWALMKDAIELAPRSRWLRTFNGILFYGFYDLTGLQRDFVEAVVKNFPSEFYLPFVKDHSAYQFVIPFWEWLVGLSSDRRESRLRSASAKETRFFNVSGLRDEAWLIAGEIWRLHLKEKIPFHEIAVIVRSKDRLTRDIPAVFEERGIPFRSSVRRRFVKSPLMKTALDRLRSNEPSGEDRRPFSAWVQWSIDAFGDSTWSDELRAGLVSLGRFDVLGRTVTRDEFLDALEERWREMDYDEGIDAPSGVSLHHAESARGLSFRAVFLAGVEERVFPRIIREDPFLRDDARRLLTKIGYRISEKLSALEEEELLFHLATESSERLTFVYQRSDDDGRIVGPSPFVRRWAAENGVDLEAASKSIQRPYLPKIIESEAVGLTEREIVLRLLHLNKEKTALGFLRRIGIEADALKRGLEVQKKLNRFDSPHAWDGLIGPLSDQEAFSKGRVSASLIESYGHCPYQYFAEHLLELKPADQEPDWGSIESAVQGKIVHKFLELFFKRITKDGTAPVSAIFPHSEFNEVFEAVIPGDPQASGPASELTRALKLPLVLWRALRRQIRADLEYYLTHDLEELTQSGFQPRYIEKEMTTALPAPLDGVQWHGFIDRMDVSEGGVRIVDYKSGRIPEGNVATAIRRGLKSQPPVYILMAEAYFKTNGGNGQPIRFSYHRVLEDIKRKDLATTDWNRYKNEMMDTIRFQLDNIRKGVFLPMPDTYCSSCDVSAVCRRHHTLSAYRSKQGPGRLLWDIRTRGKKRP